MSNVQNAKCSSPKKTKEKIPRTKNARAPTKERAKGGNRRKRCVAPYGHSCPFQDGEGAACCGRTFFNEQPDGTEYDSKKHTKVWRSLQKTDDEGNDHWMIVCNSCYTREYYRARRKKRSSKPISTRERKRRKASTPEKVAPVALEAVAVETESSSLDPFTPICIETIPELSLEQVFNECYEFGTLTPLSSPIMIEANGGFSMEELNFYDLDYNF